MFLCFSDSFSFDFPRYHVIPDGKVFSRVLKDDLTAETLLEGSSLRFNANDNSGATVNGVEIVSADERASNGVVHFLADVIYPVPAGTIYDTLDSDSRFLISYKVS